jgi:hypothetical protein
VGRVARRAHVTALDDEPAAPGRQLVEEAQQPPRLRPPAEEPQIVSQQHDRVERPEAGVELVDREHTRIAHTSPPAHLHGSRRDVDADHVVPPRLEVEADPPRAAADVEHAPAHEPHRAPVVGRPAPERGEVEGRAELARVDEAVVALDDLHRVDATVQRREQQPPVGVRFRAQAAPSSG